ncbi:MAG: alpha-xylosidase [Phycisphaerales bacterium]|nr:alpha-xylosidase [Phycisphaerales bacterium]
MKFSQGAWRWADGVTPAMVRRVAAHQIETDRLALHALDRHGSEGVDKFEGTVLSIEISSPMPDVIRVHARHYSPREIGHHAFDLDYALKANGVRVEGSEEAVAFTSGRLTLRIRKGRSWDFRFEDEKGNLVTAGPELGYMTVAGEKQSPLSNGRLSEGLRPGQYLMQRLSLGVGELIYGLGERFGPLVKNGQSIAIWNEDGGTSSDLAYKNIPFYLSNRGYGLLVNHPGQVEFEIATERVSQLQFSVPGEELDYYVFLGQPKEALEKYTRLSGRPALPPAWSFGLWLSTSFTTKYNEETVNEFVEGMASRGIPLSVFHFDCFWMKERNWCDFEWDREAFPDPEGMLKRLKSKGLKICVWINSYISQMSRLFAEGREHGYFLKRPDGSVYQRDAWQPGMALVDFTNPAAAAWYQGHLRRLMDMGVDCFKTDFAELIPLDVVYHDGSDPERMHNLYSYLYNKAVFELIESERGRGEAMVFARSGTACSQKFPVHWGGDCSATFEAMAEDLRGGLSFCSSGPAFWSHDIGGFEGTANAANYKRWVAFGLMSTHSRLHGSGSYRVPWLFDEESVDVMRQFTKLKNKLFPYLFGCAHDARDRGWPVMRAMPVEFPDDPATAYLDRQYMLGSSLLVAPVFRQDDVAEYYLPAGRWTNLISGQAIDGGAWKRETIGFMDMPLLVRESTLLAMSEHDDQPQWIPDDVLALHLFEPKQAARIEARVAGSDGRQAHFTVHAEGSRLTLESDGVAMNVRLCVRNRRVASKIGNGRALPRSVEGDWVQWSDTAKPLELTLIPAASAAVE